MNVFGHGGDVGDCLAFLPTIRALGGGHLMIGHRQGKGFGRESMRGARFEAIKPLLQEQPYIKGVKWTEDFAGCTHDCTGFRRNQISGENLCQWQARYFGVTISEDPWLTAEPDERYRGRTIFARSARYHEPQFPWRQMLLDHPDALFVGLPDEHAVFQHRYGEVEYLPTADFYDLARVMAAAALVICNQSSPFWVAIGLGVPTLQETWAGSRDSIILRPNARYFYSHEPNPTKHQRATRTRA